MKDNIIVVKAIESNYEKLREIFLNVRKSTFNWLEPGEIKYSDFDDSTKGELILIALINDEIAGFVSIWEEDKFIHNLFVLEKFQGYGVGTALINETARRIGYPLTLKCVKLNTKAYNYYISHNWRIEKEDINNENSYYLMKLYRG